MSASVLDYQAYERDLNSAGEVERYAYGMALAENGEPRLVYTMFKPQSAAADVLLFYHGGGAHMFAGYQFLASAIVRHAPLAVCLVDIRGHGLSGGNRGDAASPAAVWEDVNRVIDSVSKSLPTSRVHLGGHSSGAGMLLNYWTRHENKRNVRSLTFLAPEFGFRAPVRRRGERDEPLAFSNIKSMYFVVNALTKGQLAGHARAVELPYATIAQERRKDFIESYTVNMALALTPSDPAEQIAALDIPTHVFASQNDELFCPERMKAFLEQNGSKAVRFTLIQDANHLNATLHAARPVVDFLASIVGGLGAPMAMPVK